MSETYIRNHFADIKKYASVIENRGEDEDCTLESVLNENGEILKMCGLHHIEPILIEEEYDLGIEL